MGLASIETLVQNYSKNRSYYVKTSGIYNEHLCRTDYIDPFLEILGWDVRNRKGVSLHLREVIAENYNRDIGKPDYTITLCGVPKFYIEAKKPSVDIISDPEPAHQARKYGWNAGHKFVILTNFEYLSIYDTEYPPDINDSPNVALIKQYHYSDYVEKYTEIANLISHDAVYAANYDETISKLLNVSTIPKKSIDETFLEQINQWRLDLSTYLYKKSGYVDINKINEVVQAFINQIVFLRICEDRNLPLYHKLSEIKESKKLINDLSAVIHDADKRYNSGLFTSSDLIFDLNNEIIFDIINKLYFPQSIYEFTIIEPHILGKIYELFLTEELIIDNTGMLCLSKKKEVRDRSIVTTPLEIVRYIVKQALTPLCLNKNPNEILSLKIADICCGSGLFLEEAYGYLVNYCQDWYENHNPGHLLEISDNVKKLPFSEKKRILSSCIYGIDIDNHAVEVSKFSLLIKLIENETSQSVHDENPILPNIDKNIVFGNALISHDMVGKLKDADELTIVPFDWKGFNHGENFDAIIGNPPYVNTEGMYALLPPLEVEVYKSCYVTSYRQFDKFYIFIERALSKIKSSGNLCYIVTNKFFTNPSGTKLREFLAGRKCISRIDDFGSAQIFENKTIYCAILSINKQAVDEFTYSSLHSLPELLMQNNDASTNYSSTKLNEAVWAFSTDSLMQNIYEQLQKRGEVIGDYAEFVNGIQTSAERPPVYWFSKNDIIGETDTTLVFLKNSKHYRIEKAILKPYFKPVKPMEKNLRTYDILTSDKLIIFPYHPDGTLIKYETMEKCYPNTLLYLKDNYDQLLPKEFGGMRDAKPLNGDESTWYRYGREQALTIFNNRKKLIVGVMRKDAPLYIYDNQNHLIASGGTAGYCAVFKKYSSPYELEYLQAWLTHPYTQSILKIIGSDFEGGFSAGGTAVLKQLPFVKLDFKNNTDKSNYEAVIAKTRKIYQLNDNINNTSTQREKIILERQKKILIEEIQSIITSIYNSVITTL